MLPPDLKAGVIEVLEGAWPTGRPLEERITRPLADRSHAPVSMLLVQDTPARLSEAEQAESDDSGAGTAPIVLAYLTIPTKTITQAGHTYTASGLSAVSTHPSHRGHGHGATLVHAAYEHIAASGVDLAVFTCDEPLAAFYQAAGWTLMPTTVVVGGTAEAPFRADTLRSPEGFRKVTFMAFFSKAASTRRPDFESADVHLHLRPNDLW